MHITKFQIVLAMCFITVVGCSNASDSATVKDPLALTGVVQDEGGVPIKNVQVCMLANGACSATDANGLYSIAHDNKLVEPLAVRFAASGYAQRVRRMYTATSQQAATSMRTVDYSAQITLPEEGSDPKSISLKRYTETATLTIAANSMQQADGQIAHGQVDVHMTFWHPLEPLVSVPGSLLAKDSNTVAKGLTTFGMTSIEISQNGNLLQIASGKTLDWSVSEPTVVQQVFNPNQQVVQSMPDLYSLDTNTGLWVFEGNITSGALAYNANTNAFTAHLPHLSSWNIDADAGPQYGGCVTGKVVDPCGNPIANKSVRVWFLGAEQLKDWAAVTTSSDGSFCSPTYLSSFNVAAGGSASTLYFVAGADSWQDTGMCVPAPANCFNCDDEDYRWGTGWCSNCMYNDTSLIYQPAPAIGSEAATRYDNTCNAPSVTVTAYTTCAANNCTKISDVVMNNTATCSKTVSANGTQSTSTPDPCGANGDGKKEGEFCTEGTDTCCPRTDLYCKDSLCVPTTDPNVFIH